MESSLNRALRVLSTAGRVLTGKQLAGRNVTVFDDDVFITSYPRSGNTWTRFLIGNLIYQDDPITFSNIESRIPEIYFNPDHVMRRLPRPRILKSHESFQPRYPRVIYIVRDPRDVCVSFYHHHLKWRNIPDNYPMDAFVERFLRAEFDADFGSWEDNVGSWLSMREGSANFLMCRYEDMKRDPFKELENVASFLERHSFRDIKATPDRISRAVELSTAERMRNLEKLESGKWALTKSTRPDLPFVRTAVAGGWRSILSRQSVAAIEETWKLWIQRLGYKLFSGDGEPTAGISPDKEVIR
ncbi:MAG TPA: sulfotransferase domain-containing protein [Candidatus Acidoferrum sp.]|nr:sulfotransferase domain-containing protein [Candidatus Acidoferrum sp.]